MTSTGKDGMFGPRGGRGGIGRRSTARAEQVSRDLRHGSGPLMARRRRTTGLALGSAGALGVVSLYQAGILRHLPDLPVKWLDSDLVDASGEAYVIGSVPDAVLGLVSSGVTAALATMGTAERAREQPLIPLALAAKAVLDAGWAMVLTLEQATKHKRFCGFCLVAAAAMVAVVPQVAPEARLAWRHLRS